MTTKKFERTFGADARAAEDDDDAHGRVEFALSSEAPYERWFGIEVLDHSEKSVNLERLADGRHPFLLNHDTEKQIGVVEKAWIDPKTRMVRVAARFSRSPLAQEIRRDMEDKIRTLVSVGYFVDEVQEEKRDADGNVVVRSITPDEYRSIRQQDGDLTVRAAGEAERKAGDEPPVYRVTRWTPFEASSVPVPADTAVGVGRAAEVPQPAEGEAERQSAHSEPLIQVVTQEKPKMTEKDPNVARIERIAALGAQYSQYVGAKDVSDAVNNGTSVDKFLELIVDKQQTKHSDTRSMDVGLTKKEAHRYSFGKVVRALALAQMGDKAALEGVGFELECSRALAKVLGQSPEGIFVPYEVLRRDFNVGTASEAGNLVADDLRTDLYVDVLRANMVLPGLGARVLTGLSSNLDVPRKVTPSTLAGLTEIGSASETAPVTGLTTLTPKRVGAYTEVSKQALIQSSMPLESMLRDDLVTGAAVLIENYAIQGSSAANGTGIIYKSGLGTVTEAGNGTALIWDHLVDMESTAANANAEPDRLSGYLINTAIRGKAKKTQKGTNQGFIWDGGAQPLNGYRAAVTNNVPKALTKGTSTTIASALTFSSDWSMVVLGFFGGVDVTVDPYSKADTGQVKITLNQFWDYIIRQPDCFVVRKDILTA